MIEAARETIVNDKLRDAHSLIDAWVITPNSSPTRELPNGHAASTRPCATTSKNLSSTKPPRLSHSTPAMTSMLIPEWQAKEEALKAESSTPPNTLLPSRWKNSSARSPSSSPSPCHGQDAD